MSLYQQTIPAMIKYLRTMSQLLDKARKFCDEKNISYEDMLQFRLISDMKGLPFQVQSCTNTAKFTIERLGGAELTYLEDNETTFEQLQDRIDRVIKLLESADPKSMDGVENKEVQFDTPIGALKFDNGQRYVSEYAIPNFHFHLSSAYCILRHRGVPLGPLDYMRDVFWRADGTPLVL